MRISDWSSDVCSSDLRIAAFRRARRHALHGRLAQDVAREDGSRLNIALLEPDLHLGARERCIGADRQRKGEPARARRRHLPGQDEPLLIAREEIELALEVVQIGRHTSELQSLMRISYAVFCLKKKKYNEREYKQYTISKYIDR